MTTFSDNIRPHVQQELHRSKRCSSTGQHDQAFRHLENAHVLGQQSTRLHVLVHWRMALWGVRTGDWREVLGQVPRLIGAATKTALGWIPEGNTGGANVSPFKPMPVSTEHAELIRSAQQLH